MTHIEIIEQLYNELLELSATESCDHATGVCYCSTHTALDNAKATLDAQVIKRATG